MILGGLGKRKDRCHKWPEYSLRWLREECKEDCLQHELARSWFSRTNAFVVDVRLVFNPGGLGSYLGKYLTKGFLKRAELEALGFKRRWSCSRSWPREDLRMTEGTKDGIWKKVTMIGGFYNRGKMDERVRRDKDSPLLKSIGDDLGEVLRAKARNAAGISRLKEIERAFIPTYANTETSARRS